jgi:hypothetical protein
MDQDQALVSKQDCVFNVKQAQIEKRPTSVDEEALKTFFRAFLSILVAIGRLEIEAPTS